MRELTGRAAEPLITLEAILAFAESTKEQRKYPARVVNMLKRHQPSLRVLDYNADRKERAARVEAERLRQAQAAKDSIRNHLAKLKVNDTAGFERVRNCTQALLQNFGQIEMFDPHGFCVYLLWGDDEDRPIYVGQSVNVMGRVGSHMTSDKGPLTRKVQIVRCSSREQMCELESSLIELYQPPMNIVGR